MNRKFFYLYSYTFDRFLVLARNNRKDIDQLISLRLDGSYEYLRYIPDIGISLEDLDKDLIHNPQEICIEITKNCELNCPICIADSKMGLNQNLSLETFGAILPKLLPKKIVRMTLTGGEPTLHPDLLELLQLASPYVDTLILSTNGYHPDKIEAAIAGINNVNLAISLHGIEEYHDHYVQCKGAYKKVLQSISIAAQQNKMIHILSVATKPLLDCLPQMCEVLSSFPISELRLNLVKTRGRHKNLSIIQENYTKIVDIIDRVNTPFRITIKRKEQPFLFIDYQGKAQLLNG